MDKSFKECYKELSARLKTLPDIFANNLHLFLDDKGNIIEMSEKWSFPYLSMAQALIDSGHIRDYFDWPQSPLKPGELTHIHNARSFLPDEIPEKFYLSFPSVVLVMMGVRKNLHYGVMRMTGTLPNVTLQRPNGIIYHDGRERLEGFNRTFYNFFRDRYKKPESMLGLPLSRFLAPTPLHLQGERSSTATMPDPALMEKHFSRDFTENGSFAGLKATSKESLKSTREGLVFSNTTESYTDLTLQNPVPQNRDLLVQVEFLIRHGQMPLLEIIEKGESARARGLNEYAVTPAPGRPSRQFLLKRNGLVQQRASASSLQTRNSWRLCRAGQTLLFYQEEERKLAYFDGNYFNQGNAYFNISLRPPSAIVITSLQVFLGGQPSPRASSLLLTHLKIPDRNAFVINPMDNLSLNMNHPGIVGYVLENATEMYGQLDSLRTENRRIREVTGLGDDRPLGKSPAFLAVKETAAKAAGSDVTVLIQGETGTGKEVLANYIHNHSQRQEGLFVKVDCSTIPRELMESELFGHEKGAFTGAVSRRQGLLEQARGGTLFLDEIGNLTLEVQAKLLHFFQDHIITRVGGRRPISIDVRIIAATNRALADLVRQGQFRADLYYRMEVVSLTLPPLRERKEDIPDMCRHFIAQFNRQHNRRIRDFSAAAYEKLFAHSWPGNIRELRNTVERAAIFCEEETIPPGHIDLGPGGAVPIRPGSRGKRPLKHIGQKELENLFLEHGGVVRKVARSLGVTPDAVYDKIEKVGLTPQKLRKTGQADSLRQ
jgi:two-component system response regulator AtoC